MEMTIRNEFVSSTGDLTTVPEKFVVDTASARSYLSLLRARILGVKIDVLPESDAPSTTFFPKTPTKKLPVKLRLFYDKGEKSTEAELLILYKAEWYVDNILGMDLIPVFGNLSVMAPQAWLEL
jgi:hypothetical protein